MNDDNRAMIDAESDMVASDDKPDVLLTVKQVSEITTMKPAMIWRLRKTGRFPQPVKISDRAIRWWQSDIDEFLKSLPRV